MEALRQYLALKEIPQSVFARDIGVSQPTVSDYVNGHILPTAEKLKLISEKTGISIDKLLGNPLRSRSG